MTKMLLSKSLEDHEAGVCPSGCPYCLNEFERVWGVLKFNHQSGTCGGVSYGCPSCLSAEVNKMVKEADPNGIKAGEPGAKLDAGKVDVGLLFEAFPRALYAVAQVATFGASKYSRGGWKAVPNGIQRYDAAFGRHMLKRLKGESKDQDSGFSHRYHEAWNALASLELEIMEKENESNSKSTG